MMDGMDISLLSIGSIEKRKGCELLDNKQKMMLIKSRSLALLRAPIVCGRGLTTVSPREKRFCMSFSLCAFVLVGFGVCGLGILGVLYHETIKKPFKYKPRIEQDQISFDYTKQLFSLPRQAWFIVGEGYVMSRDPDDRHTPRSITVDLFMSVYQKYMITRILLLHELYTMSQISHVMDLQSYITRLFYQTIALLHLKRDHFIVYKGYIPHQYQKYTKKLQ